MRKIFILLLLVYCSVSYAQSHPGLRVQGRYLYDRAGERIILRGANAMIVFWDRDGAINYPELSKTGANCCRIFWRTGHAPEPVLPAADLDETIQNCIDNKMIPLISVWDATGDWSHLQTCVDYWTRADVSAVLRKHEKYLLLNIANEAGGDVVGQTEFRQQYTSAINQIRNAGIHVPLIIDADRWGRNGDVLNENGPYLLEQDPDHNLVFSWHLWDPTNWGNGSKTAIRRIIDGSIEKNICLIVGEFGPIEFGDNPNSGKINWDYLIEYAAEKEIGWLAWVWNWSDYHSIVKRSSGKYGDWANAPWGENIAVASPYSIQQTAKRPHWLETGLDRTLLETYHYSLQQNYPNPFNPVTKIEFTISQKTFVRLTIYNILGHAVKSLFSEFKEPGDYSVNWEATDDSGSPVAVGLYYCSLTTDNFGQVRKMLYLK
ncbi:T9SS C-terminal target domain-containing protein [candidate division KSB1 bacterium]|nr:cellulase family glycosylhydrolase [candidate division KSB1 bacterium]RQW05401.1 MAG: T9SS C-terminal target domain-containing protein [candidate division KSB1 bacterium]